ncbi:protein of uncharacterised function DUF222 [Mycolicibacterium aurum]|uniref:Protein of uncharacterized function DUF222 n=1 Tax=Mycolicibacterium aurum TaxID=1791 RepID=A0A3S4RIQ9_MYCAU|nr:protein of uncharacterised function DUF222 [Mycolicibacterium aurum]
MSDAELVQAITGWAAASAAADARKLAAIAELERRACADDGHERRAIDGTAIAAAQVSCALSVASGKAVGLLNLAVTLRDRLPKVGARFMAGQISPAMITTIAWRTFLVKQSALSAIDSEIADRAPSWGQLSDKKLESAIDVWIDRHDPDAVRRTRNAMRGRYFSVGDRNDAATGTTSVHGRLSNTDAALVHERLAVMIAGPCPDDPRTMDQRRGDAVGAALGAGSFFLACTCPNPHCPAKIDDGRATSFVIHVIAEQDSLDADPDPQLHGEDRARTPEPEVAPDPRPEPQRRRKSAVIPALNGAIVPAPLLAELIIGGARIRLVKPGNLDTEPGYRPSAALQRFVTTRDLTCRFPGCTRPAEKADIDHTVPWPTGLTHPANVKCYCREHHLVKTFVPGWSDRQYPDGTVTVTTAAGLTYTTKPLTTLLFPSWNTSTPPPPASPTPPAPPHPGRHLMMPTRRRTRAQNRAARITAERKLNAQERARATVPTMPPASPHTSPDSYWDTPTDHEGDDDPPPF